MPSCPVRLKGLACLSECVQLWCREAKTIESDHRPLSSLNNLRLRLRNGDGLGFRISLILELHSGNAIGAGSDISLAKSAFRAVVLLSIPTLLTAPSKRYAWIALAEVSENHPDCAHLLCNLKGFSRCAVPHSHRILLLIRIKCGLVNQPERWVIACEIISKASAIALRHGNIDKFLRGPAISAVDEASEPRAHDKPEALGAMHNRNRVQSQRPIISNWQPESFVRHDRRRRHRPARAATREGQGSAPEADDAARSDDPEAGGRPLRKQRRQPRTMVSMVV
mmetsp:Transcript_8523/g.23521  ORF Transcript_8523/g.23521 Transcript_8523/m.23521 type:complete len:281 (+) Transcript_8523:1985-2827(+)